VAVVILITVKGLTTALVIGVIALRALQKLNERQADDLRPGCESSSAAHRAALLTQTAVQILRHRDREISGFHAILLLSPWARLNTEGSVKHSKAVSNTKTQNNPVIT
jgi:hypothetical protein